LIHLFFSIIIFCDPLLRTADLKYEIIKNRQFQIFIIRKVCAALLHLLDFKREANLWGMQRYNDSMTSLGILCHSPTITCHNSSLLEPLRLMTFFFKMTHRFSIGFKSGDCEGQSYRTQTFFYLNMPRYTVINAKRIIMHENVVLFIHFTNTHL